MKLKSALFRVPILWFICAGGLLSATAGAQSGRILSPPNPNGPTTVETDIYEVEILEIDAQTETFLVEADLVATWMDPRLAFNPGGGPDHVIYQGQAAEEALKTEVWWPGFEIEDSRGGRERLHIDLRVWSDGSVLYRERFLAKIKQDFDLTDFPFDSQEISFTFKPFVYLASAVTFELPEDPGGEREWEPTEWDATDPELQVAAGWYCSESGDLCASDADCPGEEVCAEGSARAMISMTIDRIPSFYVWKIILPLVLIVLVSSAVFWISMERFPDPGSRLTIAFTSVLTVVAFDFVSAGSMPKLWYTTTLDKILITSYFFLAMNILENVFIVFIIKRSAQTAQWVDRISRIVFPPAYLFIVFMLIILS